MEYMWWCSYAAKDGRPKQVSNLGKCIWKLKNAVYGNIFLYVKLAENIKKYVYFSTYKNVQLGTKVPVHRSLNKDIISTCSISLFYYDILL